MSASLLSRSEFCGRVSEELGRPFRWWHLKFLMEKGVVKDNFQRVGGRRLFRQPDVTRVARAARTAVRAKPGS